MPTSVNSKPCTPRHLIHSLLLKTRPTVENPPPTEGRAPATGPPAAAARSGPQWVPASPEAHATIGPIAPTAPLGTRPGASDDRDLILRCQNGCYHGHFDTSSWKSGSRGPQAGRTGLIWAQPSADAIATSALPSRGPAATPFHRLIGFTFTPAQRRLHRHIGPTATSAPPRRRLRRHARSAAHVRLTAKSAPAPHPPHRHIGYTDPLMVRKCGQGPVRQWRAGCGLGEGNVLLSGVKFWGEAGQRQGGGGWPYTLGA